MYGMQLQHRNISFVSQNLISCVVTFSLVMIAQCVPAAFPSYSHISISATSYRFIQACVDIMTQSKVV